MKKIILVALLSVFSFGVNAQESNESDEQPQKQNEFKINMTNLIAFKWVDLTYDLVKKKFTILLMTVILTMILLEMTIPILLLVYL